MNIGNSIKRIRVERGLSQGHLAELCGISQTSLSQIEKGIKRPSKSTLEELCNKLEVPETILYLYGLEDSDIPEDKKEVYKLIFPSVEDMIKKLLIS